MQAIDRQTPGLSNEKRSGKHPERPYIRKCLVA